MNLISWSPRRIFHPLGSTNDSLRSLLVRSGTLTLLLAGGILAVGALPHYVIVGITIYAALHTILEICAVVVAMLIFTTGWVSAGRPQPVSNVLLAGAFLSVGLLDVLHLLSYAGMPALVTPSGPEKAINFWLAARLISALALLQFVLYPVARPAGPRLRTAILVGNLGLVGLIAWVGLWQPGWLPRTFIEGVGLTPLKIAMEYLIIAILVCAVIVLLIRRRLPDSFSVPQLLAGLITLIASAICFTRYNQVNDGFNLLGHGYKVLSDLFLYLALFVSVIREPYRALQASDARFRLLNRVTAASAASVTPEAILDTVCRELALAFEIPRAMAILVASPGARPRLVASYPELVQPPVEQDVAWLLMQARAARGAVLWEEQGEHQLALPVARGAVGEEIVGVMLLTSGAPWPSEAVELAESVTRQAAEALARAQLTQAHLLLSTAQAQAGESTLITDADSIILAVNPAFERLSGYSRDEVLGKTPRILRSGTHDQTFYQAIWTTITRGEIWRGRLVNRRRDGALYTVDSTIAPLRGDSGAITHYVAVMRDVSRELQLEAQFRHAQKMEAVGRLAGGIAHDFNNLLSVINGYSDFLLEAHPDPEDPARQDIETIRQAGERAAGLTRQLLAFSRRQPLKPHVLNLNAVLIEIEKLLRRLIGEDITVVLRLEPDLWPVAVDGGQLEQVVMNLAVNARDAMPNGGILTLATSNVCQEEAPVGRGDTVRLEVIDTGAGMNPETLEHLFEPFYTTKEPGRGTGLGLATVYGIVSQSGGLITVQSALGKGARFTIDLPRYTNIDPLADQGDAYEQPVSGAGSILLVEDEPAIRALAARVLRGQGYMVIEAADAFEAIRRHSLGDAIDLLLTDIVLPGMSGADLATELRCRQPDLRVLRMSGYPDRAQENDQAGLPFLLKPFTPALLVQVVRDTLAPEAARQ